MKRSIQRGLITGEAALRLCDGALAAARAEGQAVVVAVVDASGILVGFVAEQGAPRISHAVARDKAFTAAMTGMSSLAWKGFMDTLAANEREIVLAAPGYIGTDGGFPLHDGDQLVGGIGVSGATGDLDARCARAGSPRSRRRCAAASQSSRVRRCPTAGCPRPAARRRRHARRRRPEA